ncbi:MAG: hypothetical protein ACXVCP_13990 [Bdellovibrio sp.]
MKYLTQIILFLSVAFALVGNAQTFTNDGTLRDTIIKKANATSVDPLKVLIDEIMLDCEIKNASLACIDVESLSNALPVAMSPLDSEVEEKLKFLNQECSHRNNSFKFRAALEAIKIIRFNIYHVKSY